MRQLNLVKFRIEMRKFFQSSNWRKELIAFLDSPHYSGTPGPLEEEIIRAVEDVLTRIQEKP